MRASGHEIMPLSRLAAEESDFDMVLLESVFVWITRNIVLTVLADFAFTRHCLGVWWGVPVRERCFRDLGTFSDQRALL